MGRDGAGNPCRMRPGRDCQGQLPPRPSWQGRAGREGLHCSCPLQHLHPSMWKLQLSLQPSLAQMWGTAWGEHPRSSLMGPRGAGGVWGLLAIGVPCPLPSLEHTGCWGLLGVGKECPSCWKQVLTGGPWGSAGCF